MVQQQRRRERERLASEVGVSPLAASPLEKDLVRTGLYAEYEAGRMNQTEIGHALGNVHPTQVSRALRALRERGFTQAQDDEWVMGEGEQFELGLDIQVSASMDESEIWRLCKELVKRFLVFEGRWFRTDRGLPWIRKQFHRAWLLEMMYAYVTGGYLQIMSPPRHGKSELVATHFVVWVILRNHGIRVLYVGPNSDIVKERVAVIEEHLERDDFNEAFLPPSQTFYPPKKGGGSVWQSQRFKLHCRPKGITGNTVTGIGRGARLLSMNADLIICDDIEDAEGTSGREQREQTRRWFSLSLDSRKQFHTGMIIIGSRVHVDDLYGYNLEDPNFRTIVNSAHDFECVKPERPFEAHQDCMLFPELNPFEWLMTKKYGDEARAGGTRFEMVYYNEVVPDGFQIFTKDIVEPCLDQWRSVGDLSALPEGYRLIAGLDPSATGYQAAVLWAVVPRNEKSVLSNGPGLGFYEVQDRRFERYLVDLENQQGGGVPNALALMKDWQERYGCDVWAVEKDGFNSGFQNDARFRHWVRLNGVHVEPHLTQGLKFDKIYGVGSMAVLFRDKLIHLPYGNPESRQKVNTYVKQLYSFTDDASKSQRGKTDVLMAAWFPNRRIRRMEKEVIARAASGVKALDSSYPVSYPGLTGFSDWNEAPWS